MSSPHQICDKSDKLVAEILVLVLVVFRRYRNLRSLPAASRPAENHLMVYKKFIIDQLHSWPHSGKNNHPRRLFWVSMDS